MGFDKGNVKDLMLPFSNMDNQFQPQEKAGSNGNEMP